MVALLIPTSSGPPSLNCCYTRPGHLLATRSEAEPIVRPRISTGARTNRGHQTTPEGPATRQLPLGRYLFVVTYAVSAWLPHPTAFLAGTPTRTFAFLARPVS